MRNRKILLSGVASLLVLSTLWGCGTQSYEERVKKTAAFYAYLANLDANLENPYKNPGSGMTLRMPKPFRSPMPAPEIPKDPATQPLPPDPRLKNPLNLEIEGLIAAWTQNMTSESTEPDTWIYLVANHDRKAADAESGINPRTFLVDLEHRLMGAFQLTIPDGEVSRKQDNFRYKAHFPSSTSDGAEYTVPSAYTMIDFVPVGLINGKNLRATIAQRRLADDTQVALLAIYPQNVPNQFRQRLELALGTWDVKEVRKSRSSAKTPGKASEAAPPRSGGDF